MTELYPDIAPGEEVSIAWRDHDFKMACCDCNLVHRLRFRVDGDEVFLSATIDRRSTGQLRRWRGYGPKREFIRGGDDRGGREQDRVRARR